MIVKHNVITTVVICLVVLTACSGNKDIAARINNKPITITQVDWLIEQRGIDSKLASKEERIAALDELVDQELFAQEAERSNIRDNAVQPYAQRNRLAKAFVQTQLDQIAEPGPQAVAIYYKGNPALFAERRQYQIQQVAIDGSEELTEKIDQALESMESLNVLITWLSERAHPYQVGASIKTADELPMDMIDYLQTAVEGEVIRIQRENGIDILQVVAIEDAPLSLEEATANIVKYLRNRGTEAFLKRVVERMRANAKIELYGEFAKSNL